MPTIDQPIEEQLIHEWPGGGYTFIIRRGCGWVQENGLVSLPPYSEEKSLIWFRTLEEAKAVFWDTPPSWIPADHLTLADIEKYQNLINEISERMKEIQRLEQWVTDLQSGMYVNCVYCGHRYGPKDDVPASMADVLKEHVEQCPKHPMSFLKAELAEMKSRFAEEHSNHQWRIGFEMKGQSVEMIYKGCEKDAIEAVDDMLRRFGIETWVTLDE